MPSKANLQKIHIGKKELGISDDIYRDILRETTKKESSRDISDLQAARVLERFRELGWKPKAAKKAKASRRLADDPKSKMLRALWIQLHQAGKVADPSEAALCKFVKRMTRVDALEWLSDRNVTVVKKALTDWLAREKKEATDAQKAK
jgi:phage gp16-like protein